MNVQHSSGTDKWYTPYYLVRDARYVLGKIDLDPASDSFGNSRIKAERYITEDEDGLLAPWDMGRRRFSVFLNPPGGKRGNQSKAGLFWEKLMGNRFRLTHAIWVGFSLEHLAITQGYDTCSCGQFPFCVPRKRIQFDNQEGVARKSPSHSNIIVYIPGSKDKSDEFASTFSAYGLVIGV